MAKILVETTGAFNLMDMSSRPPQYVNHYRPAVVSKSSQIEHLMQFDKLKHLENLADEAHDAMLEGKTGDDLELAIMALPRPEKAEKPAKSKA